MQPPKSEPSKKFGRRRFVRDGLATVIGLAIGETVFELIDHFFGQKIALVSEYYSFIHPDKDIRSYDFTTTPASYSEINIEGIAQIGIGDSIQAGYVYHSPVFYSSTQYVTNAVNQHLRLGWTYKNYAKVGATTYDLNGQIDAMDQDHKSAANQIDISLSVGGDDLLKFVGSDQNITALRSILSANPSSDQVTQYIKSIEGAIDAYESRFYEILRRLQVLNQDRNYAIERIFVQSLPNLGLAEYIDIPTSSGYFRLPIKGNQRMEEIASAISERLNLAMAKAIQKAGYQSPIQIRLVDNYHTLTASNLTGIHPNQGGYTQMAENRLNLSESSFDGQVETLWQAIENNL